VGLTDRIASGDSVAFDSDAIIYFVEEHHDFISIVEPVFKRASTGDVDAHASMIKVRPPREHQAELANKYRTILNESANLTVHPISSAIAERAAAIRAQHRLTTPDAVVAATALEARCKFLVTNNGDDFRDIKDPEVLVINTFRTDPEGARN
jgi:predicted nucleic acid-binding protein